MFKNTPAGFRCWGMLRFYFLKKGVLCIIVLTILLVLDHSVCCCLCAGW